MQFMFMIAILCTYIHSSILEGVFFSLLGDVQLLLGVCWLKLRVILAAEKRW